MDGLFLVFWDGRMTVLLWVNGRLSLYFIAVVCAVLVLFSSEGTALRILR